MNPLTPVNSNPLQVLSKNFTVDFSGGKDSLASLLWVLDNVSHKNWNILYVEITGNTHEINKQFVLKTVEKLGIEDKLVVRKHSKDFFEYLVKCGIPSVRHRWCFANFKLPFFKSSTYFVNVVGVKRSDSARRKNMYKSPVFYSNLENKILVSPILDWSREQVIDYIKSHGLSLPEAYELYGHSGNCMFCPYHRIKVIEKTRRDEYWSSKILSALERVEGKSDFMARVKKTWIKHLTVRKE